MRARPDQELRRDACDYPAWPALPCPAHAQPIGGAVRFWLWPPASGDLPHITAMWERCSVATRMARFHAPVRDIPASYLETVLSDPSASLVAVPGQAGEVAALASLIPGAGSSAELGVLVEDAWQRHGIGRRLVARLIAAASARQITELTARSSSTMAQWQTCSARFPVSSA